MNKLKNILLAIGIVLVGAILLGAVGILFEKCPTVLFILITVGVFCWLVKLVYDALCVLDEAEQEIAEMENDNELV